MSEENFVPGENGEVGEESTPKVSLEKPRQEVRQGIYQEGGMQRQGEYRESADAAGGVYEQSPYQQPYPYTEPAPSQGFGVASLVLGIVSLVLFCTCVNVLLAVIAIVFGIVQLAKPQAKKGMAIAGIITSAVSLVLFVIFVISFLLSADFQEGFQRGLRNGLGEDFYYNYSVPNDDWYDDYDTF